MKKPEWRRQTEQAVWHAVLLKHKLGRLRLYKSLQALDRAINTMGWEIADAMSGMLGLKPWQKGVKKKTRRSGRKEKP
jgi:hypothetical protein